MTLIYGDLCGNDCKISSLSFALGRSCFCRSAFEWQLSGLAISGCYGRVAGAKQSSFVGCFISRSHNSLSEVLASKSGKLLVYGLAFERPIPSHFGLEIAKPTAPGDLRSKTVALVLMGEVFMRLRLLRRVRTSRCSDDTLLAAQGCAF